MGSEKPRVFVGVDVSGDATLALAADAEGRVVGIGSAAAVAIDGSQESEIAFRNAVGAAVNATLSTAKDAGVSVIGIGVPRSTDRARAAASSLFKPIPVMAAPRCMTALLGAGAGREGIVLLVDSGAMAYGRTADGRDAQAGGWGGVASDEGGALWIGQEGLRAAFRAHDGRTGETELLQLVPARLGAKSMDALQAEIQGAPLTDLRIAALADDVVAAASRGDKVAQTIANHAALHLANMAAAVHRKLWEPDEDVPCFRIGGLLQSAVLQPHLDGWVEKLAPTLYDEAPEGTPVMGALLLAYRAAGIAANEEMLGRLSSGAPVN